MHLGIGLKIQMTLGVSIDNMQKDEFDDVKIYLKNVLLEEEIEYDNSMFFKKILSILSQ